MHFKSSYKEINNIIHKTHYEVPLKKGKTIIKCDCENTLSDEEGQAYDIDTLNLGDASNDSSIDLD